MYLTPFLVNRSISILVVERNVDHQLLIGYSLRASIAQTEPVFSTTVEETLRYLAECTVGKKPFPKLVLLGIYLPDLQTGWLLLKEIRMHYPCLPVLVLSDYNDSDFVQHTYERGAHSVIAKPRTLQDWKVQFQIIGIYWLGTVTLASKYR